MDNSWEVIKLFNEGKLKDAPSTTGLTLVQKKTPKLHLVTVVGDFHKELTLIQMLTHYHSMVDDMIVCHYVTGKKSSLEVGKEQLEFNEYLKENLQSEALRKVRVQTVFGEKYDWDKVTEIYNGLTCDPLGDPEDWWIISDCDELQEWPEEPKKIIQRAETLHCTFVTGGFLDRIGPGGTFPKISGPQDNLNTLFPLVGFFRYPMSQACPNKVVAVKAGQKVCSGQHYAVFPDGTNSWGKVHSLRFPIEKCFVQVHHFKFDETVLKRLKETGESGCSYSEEYLKMWNALKEKNSVDITNLNYGIEEYRPELGYFSYQNWNELRNTITSI